MADLLQVLVDDGSAIAQPLCSEAADLKAGYKYGKPGFPMNSGVLRRKAEEKGLAFIAVAMGYGRAVSDVVAKLEGMETPAWLPAPGWLAAALEEVAKEGKAP